ncbi:MAG: hypothetical protein R3B48_10955 [Kofleriaceae bacterium]
MSAGHDFNALLLGALYGELSAVEESRLQAHLLAHPADEAVLRELAWTREIIRDAAGLAPVEPPQAISAILLQEAARRAPRRSTRRVSTSRRGWLAALFSHPAIAAAAMVVIVVGLFGTLSLRKKGQVAETVARSPASLEEPRGEAAPAAAAIAPAEPAPLAGNADRPSSGTTTAGDLAQDRLPVDLAVEVGQSENERLRADPRRQRTDQKAKKSLPPEPTLGDNRLPAPKPTPAKPTLPAYKNGYLDASRDDVALKELDDEEDGRAGAQQAERRFSVPPGKASSASPAAPTSVPPPPQARPPAAAPIVAPAPEPAPSSAPQRAEGAKKAESRGERTTTVSGAARPSEPQADQDATKDKAGTTSDPTVEWARSEHRRLVRLARSGKCSDAASVAGTLATRSPRYYQDHVANDRELRACAAAIRDEVNLRAEQSKRKARSSAADKE